MLEIIKDKTFILFVILVMGVCYANNFIINQYDETNDEQIVYNG